MASVAFLVMCEVIVFLSGERVPLFYITLFTILIANFYQITDCIELLCFYLVYIILDSSIKS